MGNCDGRRLQNSTGASDSISTEVASSSSEDAPRRRLWVCPQGFVGKDQCDASPRNSQCCGYSVPGENCGNRADCFCYQWNCDGRRLQNSTGASTSISTEVASNSSEDAPRRRLWVCPQGFVGKDQCDASPRNSQCCGYSVPGENCGSRADCFCYQWNCDGRRLQNSTMYSEFCPTSDTQSST